MTANISHFIMNFEGLNRSLHEALTGQLYLQDIILHF